MVAIRRPALSVTTKIPAIVIDVYIWALSGKPAMVFLSVFIVICCFLSSCHPLILPDDKTKDKNISPCF